MFKFEKCSKFVKKRVHKTHWYNQKKPARRNSKIEETNRPTEPEEPREKLGHSLHKSGSKPIHGTLLRRPTSNGQLL
jgi:hypothetical protein